MQRWQFALQRELPARAVVELSYVGNRRTRQRVGRQLNALPLQYLSTSPVRDQQTIDYLSRQVPNPFCPMLPKTSLAGATVSRSQLLHSQRAVDRWFNVDAGFERDPSKALSANVRTFPIRFSGVRVAPLNN